jgi:hypothetical protein
MSARIVRVADLTPGDILASGAVVATVETGGNLGTSFRVTFEDGKSGTVGQHFRVLVKS